MTRYHPSEPDFPKCAPFDLGRRQVEYPPYPPEPPTVEAVPPPVSACESCGVAIDWPGMCTRCNRAVAEFCEDLA